MVHIIIAVLAVAAHTIQIFKAVQERDNLIHMVVSVEIGWICLFHTLTVRGQHIVFLHHAHPVSYTHLDVYKRQASTSWTCP